MRRVCARAAIVFSSHRYDDDAPPKASVVCNMTWAELLARGRALSGVTSRYMKTLNEVATWHWGMNATQAPPRRSLTAAGMCTQAECSEAGFDRDKRAPHEERIVLHRAREGTPAHAPLARGDVLVHRDFLNASELRLLRDHFMFPGGDVRKVIERRDTYARGKQLLDLGSKRVRAKLPASLIATALAAFERAHKATMATSYVPPTAQPRSRSERQRSDADEECTCALCVMPMVKSLAVKGTNQRPSTRRAHSWGLHSISRGTELDPTFHRTSTTRPTASPSSSTSPAATVSTSTAAS